MTESTYERKDCKTSEIKSLEKDISTHLLTKSKDEVEKIQFSLINSCCCG